MSKYFKLMRIKHWIKNVLIFVPLFFSLDILNTNKLFIVFLGFLVFSFISSTIYIFNDIEDIEKDRLHPIKKNRPLASKQITIKSAIFVMLALIMLSLLLTALIYTKEKNIFVFIIPITYLIINVFYSKGLKNKPIIDVVLLMSGFLLRVMFGGVIIDVTVSKWLYLMVVFGAFYLGFGKRRNEMIQNNNNTRAVLKFYNKEFLDKNMYVCLTLALSSYTLWCVDSATIQRVGNDYLYWTVPVVMIIFLLYSLDIEGNSHGDPVEVILANKILIGVITLYVLIMILLLYIL